MKRQRASGVGAEEGHGLPPPLSPSGTLFPVFAQAREKARQSACASNERQLAEAVLMYVQDSDEILPPTAVNNTDGNSAAPSVLWPDQLAAYVNNTEVWLCPSDGGESDLTTPRTPAYELTAPDADLNEPFDARPSARHFARANIAFMDGHVRALRLEQFYTAQTPPGKWFTP